MGPVALMGTVTLTPWRDVLLVAAGVGAGIANGVAGGGTLISFPVLLALGYPALTANMTNTVGIWPGYLGSIAGYRTEVADQRDRLRRLAPVAIVGAVIGAALLLTTPAADFAAIAPWLVLAAAALFGLQPLLRRWLGGPGEHPHRLHRALLVAGTFGASVYGGYFGAGMGVVLMAVLGLALPDTLARTGGLRSILSVLVNGVAAVIFIIHGSLAWAAVAFLAAGGLVGGWAGARLALRLPAPVLRAVVVVFGLVTFLTLILR